MKILPNNLWAVTFQLSIQDTKNYIVKNVTYKKALKCRENRARKIERMNKEIDNLRYIDDL